MQNIVKALYVYADAVNFLELKVSEITSAGFSQQTLVLRSPGLPGLFRCPCTIIVLTCLKKKKRVMGVVEARVSSGQCRLWCFWKHFRKCFSDVTLYCLHFIMLLERGYLIPSSYMVIQFSICMIHKVLIDWPCFYGEYLLGSTDAGGDSEVLQTTPGP